MRPLCAEVFPVLKCRCLVVAVLAAVTALPVAAQEKATLAWKFEKDKPFFQEMTTTARQSMKVMGQDVTQNQTQTFYFAWTPEKKDGDTWIIKQKIEGVAMEIEIGGNKISYDSQAKEQQQNPLTDFFKALVGQEFKLTITKDAKDGLKVTKVEGRKEFVDNLAKALGGRIFARVRQAPRGPWP